MNSINEVIHVAFSRNFDLGTETKERNIRSIIYKYYINGGLNPMEATLYTSKLIGEFVSHCLNGDRA